MMLSKASSDLITLSESLTFYSGALRGKLMGKFIDLTGRVFGRLTVLSRAENTKGRVSWRCQCSCGKESHVTCHSLQRGATNSCGCLMLEINSTNNGATKIPGYKNWQGMVSRCTNRKDDKYPRYGGAGILVCADWQVDFFKFLSYIGPKPTHKHSIDRIENTKGYEPGNVRWATGVEQTLNRRVTVMVDYNGVRQPLAALARSHGLDPHTVRMRVKKYGWSVEKALTTPAT